MYTDSQHTLYIELNLPKFHTIPEHVCFPPKLKPQDPACMSGLADVTKPWETPLATSTTP